MNNIRTHKLPGWIIPVLIGLMLTGGYIFFDNYSKQLKLRGQVFELDAALSGLYRLRTLQSDTESEELSFRLTRDSSYLQTYNTEKSTLLAELVRYREHYRLLLALAGQQAFGTTVISWLSRLDEGLKKPSPSTGARDKENGYVKARQALRMEFNAMEEFLLSKRKVSGTQIEKFTRQNTTGYILLQLLAVGLMLLALWLNTQQLRQQYRAELNKKDEDIRAAFEFAFIGKALVSPEGHFIQVNRSICQILGYTEEELKQMKIQDLTPPGDQDRDAEQMQLMLEKKISSYEIEKRYITRRGAIIWVLLSVTAVWNEEGRLRYFISQLKDITTEKKSKKDLADSNEELEQFAYTASHDMKEPLRMIGAFMGMLEKNYGDKLDETARKYIHFATDGASRMNKLINDLLEYSRAGRTGSTPVTFSVDELLKEITLFNKAVIESRQAEIRWKDMPEVFFSRTALRQVFQNLIGNALKYQAETAIPVVEITATDLGASWEFSVRDNGIGFDLSKKEKIFTLFQRLHGKSEYPGSGIGLPTCKKIVESAGGSIYCDSVPGKGSVFYFTILKKTKTDVPEQKD